MIQSKELTLIQWPERYLSIEQVAASAEVLSVFRTTVLFTGDVFAKVNKVNLVDLVSHSHQSSAKLHPLITVTVFLC